MENIAIRPEKSLEELRNKGPEIWPPCHSRSRGWCLKTETGRRLMCCVARRLLFSVSPRIYITVLYESLYFVSINLPIKFLVVLLSVGSFRSFFQKLLLRETVCLIFTSGEESQRGE
jgi:hypothetical protein